MKISTMALGSSIPETDIFDQTGQSFLCLFGKAV
jgi:hypothetical protein